MKNITERFVNESREIEYHVAFLDTEMLKDRFHPFMAECEFQHK